MPFDVSAGSFAATAITALFWWTVLSPIGLLAVGTLCAPRPRLRQGLTLAVVLPPILVLMPMAAMHTGPWRLGTAAAALLDGAAAVLAAATLIRLRVHPGSAPRYAGFAIPLGVAGGMVGSASLVGALILL